MKLTIVLTIFYGGILWGFWLVYEVMKYRYGNKIKNYLQAQRWKAEVLREYALIDFERKANIVKRNEVQEIEVEDMGVSSWDYVDRHGQRSPNWDSTKHIDITPVPLEISN